jgi:hypothetical protein
MLAIEIVLLLSKAGRCPATHQSEDAEIGVAPNVANPPSKLSFDFGGEFL